MGAAFSIDVRGDLLARIAALWDGEHSKADIGRALKVSKGVVTGLVFRARRMGDERFPRRQKPKNPRPRKPRPAPVERMPEAPRFYSPGPIAPARVCQWPIEGRGSGIRFCEAPVEAVGRPYCAEHCAIAFEPVRPRLVVTGQPR